MMQHMQGGPPIQPPMQGQPHLPMAQPMPLQQQQPPQVQQQHSSAAPPPQAAANPTPPADAKQATPTPAPVTVKSAPPPETSAPPAEQLTTSGAANASPAPPSSSAAAPQPAATAALVAHANGGPDASSWQPQQAQAPQVALPAAPQARAKVSAGDAETMQNLKRQLLHLKKTTEHREYFDLDNMTMLQLESTIKRVQEANGIPTKKDAGEKARGRANTEVAIPGLRSDDDWEVVAPTKKGSTALVRTTDKKILTPTHADRNGMTKNILHGLFLYTEVLTANEESHLVNFVNEQVAKGVRRELAGNTYYKGKHMTAQLHYGVFYNIAENSLGGKTVEPVPEELNRLINKLTTEGILKQQQRPNTALVSVMEEGDGMLPHVDSKEFARPICTLSLLADNEMLFGDKSGQIEAHGIGVYMCVWGGG
jgi:alkylated DNA repair dioxygenase AlkB